ncbi:MAG: hypothetical protein SOZ54_05260 [Candidatus Limiplasma sp.]|nr:hypothetical protein [Clostridiales bacterium]MDY3816221.1 hypothetical protein [Candidatus Limiplasma sp.]
MSWQKIASKLSVPGLALLLAGAALCLTAPKWCKKEKQALPCKAAGLALALLGAAILLDIIPGM